MSADPQGNRPLSEEELQELVASSDAGARDPAGNVGLFLAIVAAIWSIFQVVLASPLSNVILPGSIVNNARQFHLAFALQLGQRASLVKAHAPTRLQVLDRCASENIVAVVAKPSLQRRCRRCMRGGEFGGFLAVPGDTQGRYLERPGSQQTH